MGNMSSKNTIIETTGGAAHVTQDGWSPTGGTTATTQTLFDFTDDRTALSATGAPTTGSIKRATFTSGENVTAVMLHFHRNATVAVGIDDGCYVAINAANATTELTDGGNRYWVPAGVPRLLKFSVPITTVDAIAMCAVDNQLDVEPF